MSETKQTIGTLGEEHAVKLYEKHDFKILIRNFYNPRGRRLGEIDFIALKNNHLHFVEVKTRTNAVFGEPAEALTFYKRQRIVRCVQFFLALFKHFSDFELHIDVVSVHLDPFDKKVQRIRICTDAIEDIY